MLVPAILTKTGWIDMWHCHSRMRCYRECVSICH